MAKYEILANSIGRYVLSEYEVIGSTTTNTFTLNGLLPNSRYWVSVREVRGVDDKEKGAFATPISVTTTNFDSQQYEIHLSEIGAFALDTYNLKSTADATNFNTAKNRYEITLDGLEVGKRYFVMSRQVQNGGSLKGAFSYPQNFTIINLVAPYSIFLAVEGSPFHKIGEVNILDFSFSGLNPSTTYLSKISTIDYDGAGNVIVLESNTISFETPGLPTPVPKENVQGELVIGGSFPYKYTFKQDTVSNKTTVSFRCRTDTLKEVFFIEGDVND